MSSCRRRHRQACCEQGPVLEDCVEFSNVSSHLCCEASMDLPVIPPLILSGSLARTKAWSGRFSAYTGPLFTSDGDPCSILIDLGCSSMFDWEKNHHSQKSQSACNFRFLSQSAIRSASQRVTPSSQSSSQFSSQPVSQLTPSVRRLSRSFMSLGQPTTLSQISS